MKEIFILLYFYTFILIRLTQANLNAGCVKEKVQFIFFCTDTARRLCS